MDFPLHNEDYQSSATYPPRISLHIWVTKMYAGKPFSYLGVKGIDEKLELLIKIPACSELKKDQSNYLGMFNMHAELNIIYLPVNI